jgi:hypothetical protein
MPQDPFPGPGPDDAEPDGSPLPPAAEDEDGPGPEQGLYVCLPAEHLTLSGFAQGGAADTMPPGALLGTVVEAVTGEDGTGLPGCSDDQLMGIISAARRQQSRSAWTQLAAMREFAARHAAGTPEDAFAADELAAELHLTPLSAAEQIEFAATVARRLPKAFAALAAGRIHPVHLRIIEDETSILSDADAATADALLAEAAPGMTFGEVRSAAHKLVLKLDPDAVRKRKEAGRREAHVRRFREDSGNAGMVARELPSDEVLASWQHVEQRALDLRAAGLPGTLQDLRVRAYLDLLQERDSRLLPADPADPAGTGETAETSETGQTGAGGPDQPPADQPSEDQTLPDQPPPDTEPPGSPGTSDGPGGPGSPEGPGGPGNGPGGPPGRGGPAGPGSAPRPDAGPSLAALVTITVPLDTWQGQSDVPGEAGGFGLLDGDAARDLAAAAARHPRTRWCVTALNPDGTAAAHGCLPGRHPPPGPAPGPGPGPDPPPGTGPQDWIAGLRLTLTPVARGTCDHAHAEPGYQPSRRLRHLVRARNARCTAPGCGRPAARCDLDHTVPWDQGGLTCECDLAPLCRHHHRCKQSQGWKLEQPSPGVMIWLTPAGRTYATGPTVYPI